MMEKTKLQLISDLAFDIQHTNDPQIAFDKAGEILRLIELDQPTFKIGEYYSYKTMDNVLHILKITAVRGDKVDFTFLNTKSGSLVNMDNVKLDKRYIQPASDGQIATFKRAEQFAKLRRRINNSHPNSRRTAGGRSMKPLSEQAAEHLQEQYRQTLHYALKNFVINLTNLFAKQPLPEPQYKDRYTESVYYEELIATMDCLHEQSNKPKTVQLSDYLNEQNIKLTAGQVREALDDILGKDRYKWQ